MSLLHIAKGGSKVLTREPPPKQSQTVIGKTSITPRGRASLAPKYPRQQAPVSHVLMALLYSIAISSSNAPHRWVRLYILEQEASRRGFYIPCLKTQIRPFLSKTKKLYASRFYQLKSGHGAIGIFLERIK